MCNCGCGEPLPEGRTKPHLQHHDKNRVIACACGCGEQFYERNKWGAKRSYVNHHAMQHKKLYATYAEAQKARRARNKNKAAELGTVTPRYLTKRCNRCRQLGKHFFNCHYMADGSPEFKTICSVCAQKWNKKWQKENRGKLNRQAALRKKKKKQECISYKGGKCKECDYMGRGREMTFHHRPGVDKVRNISEMLDWSWLRLKVELDKCVLLCFRCHMRVEDEISEVSSQIP